MNMMKKTIIAMIAVILTVAVPVSYVNACGKGPRRDFGDKEAMKARLIQELGISAQQQQQLDVQREQDRKKFSAIREELKIKRARLRQELEKDDIDMDKVASIIADIKNAMGKELDLKVDKIIATRSILTKEQFAKLGEKMKHRSKNKRFKHKR